MLKPLIKPLLAPPIIRKQISHRKFDRIKDRLDSKRVRLFLNLNPYEMQEALDAYDLGDHYYVFQGNRVETGSGYRTQYFRYEKTAALYSPYRLGKI